MDLYAMIMITSWPVQKNKNTKTNILLLTAYSEVKLDPVALFKQPNCLIVEFL